MLFRLFFLGYNFDAISCESCKAFFRRNVLHSLVVMYFHYEKDLF